MSRFGIWQIKDSLPRKLNESSIDLEKNLESWIEKDPSLIQAGLVMLARQMRIEDGRLDLLALDPQGRLVLIEIKSGNIRSDTIGQSLFYAANLSEMPFGELQRLVNEYLKSYNKSLASLLNERGIYPDDNWADREIFVHLVGTGRAAGLEKVVRLLTEKYEVPITITAFEVFELKTGELVLTRETTEYDVITQTRSATSSYIPPTLDELITAAEKKGLGAPLKELYDHATSLGLHTRLYTNSIMFAPSTHKTRMLFTIWVKGGPAGKLKSYVSPEALAEFYPISEEKATEIFGADGWHYLTALDLERFSADLDQLMVEEQEG